ncbi:nuclear transcription factor Y subunit A-3-like isoform X1 [Cucurbita pepo subsp. pepo]|uniref:nuclear transcription factor Y subunit A-3-like isoform X1 n=1 Tax=Cucurbita pepo subsp. pepo TaxID=3664 RepID=UPI000C9D71A8|nr:nuclear transcription factor Y subunit A-3-like isoform X1 [Cucurbita pepo subsp. pepo]XP_023537394.1 nuclear transcription factor Y subunit A-3-like isoform X1 [Cucurbita pepo subsp. pepo]XP_023537395.1 nuclear transcription factor Y subunit A-3-like isoform X1 [Cucurbita pepo subsp. pepo]
MMAIPRENFAQKNLDQNSVHLLFPYTVDSMPWRNSNEQKIQMALSDNITLKNETPPQPHHEQSGLRLRDQESSTAYSMGQSLHKVRAMEVQNAQEQCISSESGLDENYGESVENQMKPVILFSNPEYMFNPPQVDSSHLMARVPYPYPYVDPSYGGLFCSAYGQMASNLHDSDQTQAQVNSNVVGSTPARVPLPHGLAEDGLIYVNAKQYHGIIRRRKSRAKLEAQNKVIRNRKPYLHESRHCHAVNRVRGSGGRFLSAKKDQPPDHITPPTDWCQQKDTPDFNTCSSETGDPGTMTATCSETTSISSGSVMFGRTWSDSQFSAVSSSGGFVHDGARTHASVV